MCADELIQGIVRPMLTNRAGLLRPGALIVLTFKAMRGHSEPTWLKQVT